jgi:hypothetical protein
MPKKQHSSWREIKDEWMLSRLAGKPVSVAELAKRYNISEGTIRNRSSSEKWSAELSDRMESQEAVLSRAMVERSEAALEELRRDFIGSEIEVRRRHAIMARGMQLKAVQRLTLLPPDQLSARDALAMLKLGLDEERRALGYAETYVAPKSTPLNAEYNEEVVRMADHEQIKTMGVAFLKLLQQRMEEFQIVPEGESGSILGEFVNESADDEQGPA